MLYLAGFYWPYLIGAAVVGVVVGWRSFRPTRRSAP